MTDQQKWSEYTRLKGQIKADTSLEYEQECRKIADQLEI